MTLLVLLVGIFLLITILVIVLKKIKFNKMALGLILIIFASSVIFLYKTIPVKLKDMLKKQTMAVEQFSTKPELENEIIVTIDDSKNYIFFKANEDIYNVEFYLIEAKEDGFVENALITRINQVLKNENLIVEAFVPEIVPNLKIKWKTKNDLQGELIVSKNLNSNNEYNIPIYKQTISSFVKAMLN